MQQAGNDNVIARACSYPSGENLMNSRIVAIVLFVVVARPVSASVTTYTDLSQWLGAVGPHTYIGFTEYPDSTLITTQYASQGVLFTDGNDFIELTASFPGDGAGLRSVDFTPPFGGNVHMSFRLDRTSIAFDFIGTLLVELYSNGQLVFTSDFHGFNSTFVGFISDEPFDAVIAYDGDDEVIAINNLYFGAPVPSPATLASLFLGAIIAPTRRRRA